MVFDTQTWNQARAFMTELRVNGFECGETHGGVTVFDHSITIANQASLLAIAEKHGVSQCLGGQTFASTFRDAIRAEGRSPRSS